MFNWELIWQKIGSRKFWAMVANFVSMLLIAARVEESVVAQVAALIAAFGGIVVYLIVEGKIDAERAKNPEVKPISIYKQKSDEVDT